MTIATMTFSDLVALSQSAGTTRGINQSVVRVKVQISSGNIVAAVALSSFSSCIGGSWQTVPAGF